MVIEVWSIGSVRPYDSNPRNNEAAVEAVARSIREYGFRQPIVVDGSGTIVCGHTRLKAAQSLGLNEVPVHVARDLSPEQVKALRIADNRLHELATWDNALLAVELDELADLGVDVGLLGFTPEQIAAITNEPIGTEGQTDPDDVPEPQPAASVVTQRGDLWVLGDHRLLCGDSTDARDVDRLMDGQQAALVATDPPYLVDYSGERPNDSGKDWSATYREVEITDADQFFRGVFTNVLRVLAPHAAVYCWHAHKRQALISQVWEDLGILDHQQIVWVKPTPVFGRVYWHFRHEPCMMGWRKGSQPVHDSDHTHNSVWEVDWEGKSRIVGNEHPTQKPVELFARPMRKHTQAGDICFEPFSGSGSQLIAAEQLGRRCFAMELEPVFVEVAVRRWEAFTGKTAQRIPASTADESDRSNENAATKAAAGKDA
jgi:DNA modification methylase